MKDYLRGEEREVNHHGRVRKIGEEGENEDKDDIEVLKNNWVGDSEQLGLDLISRHEDVQVCGFHLFCFIISICLAGCCSEGILQKSGC